MANTDKLWDCFYKKYCYHLKEVFMNKWSDLTETEKCMQNGHNFANNIFNFIFLK